MEISIHCGGFLGHSFSSNVSIVDSDATDPMDVSGIIHCDDSTELCIVQCQTCNSFN